MVRILFDKFFTAGGNVWCGAAIVAIYSTMMCCRDGYRDCFYQVELLLDYATCTSCWLASNTLLLLL